MVTGIKLISQQQVISSSSAMGSSGITATQIPSQEALMKRAAAASETRRVSFRCQKFLRNQSG